MDIKVSLGAKYYNDKEFIRIIKFKNAETIRVKDLITNTYKTMKVSELDKYTLLMPDAAISFNIVRIGETKDVIVACNRSKGDQFNNTPCPYLILRQNITDIHANIVQKNTNIQYVGCSATIDNIPEGVDFNILSACDELLYFCVVYYYIDDKLDDILECIPKISRYDQVLEEMNRMYCKFKNVPYTPGLHGYYSKLVDLIKYNNMMYDIRVGFNIIPIKQDMIIDGRGKLHYSLKENLEIIATHRMIDEFAMEYKKDIDLSKLRRKYILVCDASEKLYIVQYTQGDTITYDPDRDLIINLDRSKY